MAQVFHDRSVIRILRIPAQEGTFDKAVLSYSESTGESYSYVNPVKRFVNHINITHYSYFSF